MLKKMVLSLFAASFLSAAPQAVVFDWGKVLANPDRGPIVSFLSAALSLTPDEFEKANLQKRSHEGSELDYWINLAAERGVALPFNFPDQYRSVSRAALNIDASMYRLVEELKASGITIALLSNIPKRYGDLIRSYGLYDPFAPCLLSGEIGVEKPNPKAYEILLRELALPASDVVFVDDLAENIEAARKIGIDAIRFESLPQLQKELQRRGL